MANIEEIIGVFGGVKTDEVNTKASSAIYSETKILDNKDVVCTTLCIDEHDEQSKPQSEISKENKSKEIKANDGTRKKATRQTKV